MKKIFSFCLALILVSSLCAFSSFADSDSDVPIYPEDLLGYTFTFNETITESNFLNEVDFFISFVSNGRQFDLMNVTTWRHPSVWFDDIPIFDDGGVLVAGDAYRTVVFTGGEDTANPLLIQFLYENGTFSNTAKDSIYGIIFTALNTIVFGDAVVGTAPYLACTLLSLIACVFLVALPFLIVFKIFSMVGAW